MLKELIQEQQPIVYKALETACLQNEISSAYLFAGPYGTPKKEAAILVAQSIFCENGKIACEECNTCRRVKDNLYSDFVILDGKEESISKEMIDNLQAKFAKTALEKNGQRVYIILNAENASVAAQNSMLKFLEEPGKGITAILTTDNSSRLLPTILSRCTILSFVPMKHDAYEKMAIEAGIDQENTYFVSHIAKNMDDLNTLYPCEDEQRNPSRIYENAISMFRQYLDEHERKDLLIDYDISYRNKEKNAKKENMILLNAFFDLLLMYAHDVILQNQKGPQWYQQKVVEQKNQKQRYQKFIMLIVEEKDKVNKYNDLNLVMDQACYRLEKWNHE